MTLPNGHDRLKKRVVLSTNQVPYDTCPVALLEMSPQEISLVTHVLLGHQVFFVPVFASENETEPRNTTTDKKAHQKIKKK